MQFYHWQFELLTFVAIHHFGNRLHEDTENPQQIYIESAYMLRSVVFGCLFLIIMRTSSENSLYFLFHHIQNGYEMQLFAKCSELWKCTIFINLVKKIRTVKIPKCLAQYHTTPVILSCKIWPHSNKVSVWVEYLNTTGNIYKYIGHFCYICGWLHNNVATSLTKNHTPVAFMAPKQWLWLELVRNM